MLAALTLSPAGAAVDTTRRSETFEPKPTTQPRVEMERTEVGESRLAADEKLEFVTVPATEAKARMPAIREKEKAPIEMAARPFPMSHPEPATISTDRVAPAKFEKKFDTPTVARIQEGMTEAGRVKTASVKAKAKGSVLERINRFVFRRNPTETGPAITPAGGENTPAEGAPAPADSAGS